MSGLIVTLGIDSRDFDRRLRQASARIGDAGAAMTKGLTVPLMALGVVALASAVKFDTAMGKIQAGTGATGDALVSLGKTMRSVMGVIPVDANTAASALAALNTHTGATGEELRELTKTVVAAAKVLGVDAAQAADDFGRIIKANNIPIQDASLFMDAFLKITMDTGIGLDALQKKILTFGPVMSAAGFSTAETAVLFGRLHSVGIDVSRVMPALNASLRRWAGEGKDARTELDKLIVSIKAAETDTAALTIATEAFGAEGAVRMAKAIQDGTFALNDLGKSLEGVSGLTRRTEKDTRTFSDSFLLLKSNLELALEPLGVELLAAFEKLKPSIIAFLERIMELTAAFSRMHPTLRSIIVGFGVFLAALGPVLMLLPPLIAGFVALKAAILGVSFTAIIAGVTAFGGALKLLMIPLFKVIGVLAAIVAIVEIGGRIFNALGFNVGKNGSIMTAAFERVRKKLGEFRDSMLGTDADTEDFTEEAAENTKELERLLGVTTGTVIEGNKKQVKSAELTAEEKKAIEERLTEARKSITDKHLRWTLSREKYALHRIEQWRKQAVIDYKDVAGAEKMINEIAAVRRGEIEKKSTDRSITEAQRLGKKIVSIQDKYNRQFMSQRKYALHAVSRWELEALEKYKEIVGAEDMIRRMAIEHRIDIELEAAQELADKKASIQDAHNRQFMSDEEYKHAQLRAWEKEALQRYGEIADAKIKIDEIVEARRKEIHYAHVERELSFYEKINEKINKWMERQKGFAESIGVLIASTFDKVSDGISKAVADGIVFGKNLGDSLRSVFKSVVHSVIQGLIKIGVQTLIAAAIERKAILGNAIKSIASSAAKAFSAAYAAIAAIPVVGPFIAPAIAIAAGAAVFAGGRALLGRAHGGLTDVREDATYEIQRGERIVAVDQNRDLTEFLRSPAIVPEPAPAPVINMTIQAMDAESFTDYMTENREVLAGVFRGMRDENIAGAR